MRTPFAYLLLAVAIALAIGLAFLFGVHGGAGRVADLRPEPPSFPERADSERAGLRASTPVSEKATVPGRESAVSTPSFDPVANSEGVPTPESDSILVVHTVSKSNRTPLARIRVILFPRDQAQYPGHWSAAGTLEIQSEVPITAEEGRVEFAIPSGIDCTVLAHAEDGETGGANAEVPALRPAERRELTLELPTGPDLQFVIKLVADEDQTPIAGARVRVIRSQEETNQHGEEVWMNESISESVSGADGLLELALQSWKGAHVRVEAEGFGMTLLAPVPGHETVDKALLVPLLRGAVLRARVVDASGTPVPGAAIRLSTIGYELNRPPRERSGTGWIQMPDEAWTGVVDSNGGAVLQDLPPALELTVEIMTGREVLRRERDPLVFLPGQVLEAEWRIGTGCTLHGLVLDQSEHPVSAQEIWLTRAYSESPRYLSSDEENEVIAKAVTDPTGHFLLKDVPAEAWSLGPAALALGGDEAPEDAIAPLAVTIEVTGSGTREITLHVHRGMFIRGIVLDSAGGRATPTDVNASMDGVDWGLFVRSGQDGSFALGPLAPGRFLLTADDSGTDAASDPVYTEAGAKDVVLRLRPGGRIHGRVVDGLTGEGCRADMLVTPVHPSAGSLGRGFGLTIHDDGSFDMQGLEPGRYGVSARTEDGRFGVVAEVDLTAGNGSDAVTVTVSRGGRLNLRYEGAGETELVTIRMSGVPIDRNLVLEPGKVLETKAPAGTLLLEFASVSGANPVSRTVVLASGEEKEYVFRDGE